MASKFVRFFFFFNSFSSFGFLCLNLYKFFLKLRFPSFIGTIKLKNTYVIESYATNYVW